jgi:hypothetical protein
MLLTHAHTYLPTFLAYYYCISTMHDHYRRSLKVLFHSLHIGGRQSGRKDPYHARPMPEERSVITLSMD